MKTIIRRMTAFALAALMTILLLPMTGCAANDWEGTWHRTGDATYSRAEMTISDAGGSDFVFSVILYNGNVAGQVTELSARYTDSDKRSARCTIPETKAHIDFSLDSYGNIDMIYGYDISYVSTYETVDTFIPDPRSFIAFYPDEYIRIPIQYEKEVVTAANVGIIESELFDFEAPAYVTGHYTRDEVEYINSSLYQAGILTAEEDERVRSLMTEGNYFRLLDCFQTWKISNGKESVIADDYDPHERKDRHEDEIGGYVFYGSNTMQEQAAIIIVYDDGTASVVVSLLDDAPVYYSSNAIYKDGSLTPLPIKRWLEDYHKEQEKMLAAAQAAQQNQQ